MILRYPVIFWKKSKIKTKFMYFQMQIHLILYGKRSERGEDMAKRPFKEEQQRPKADFDEPKKKGGNGRPPSPRPRTSTLTVRLTEAEKEKLEEAALLTGETKTGIIVRGIEIVYSKAIAAEKKRLPKAADRISGEEFQRMMKLQMAETREEVIEILRTDPDLTEERIQKMIKLWPEEAKKD